MKLFVNYLKINLEFFKKFCILLLMTIFIDTYHSSKKIEQLSDGRNGRGLVQIEQNTSIVSKGVNINKRLITEGVGIYKVDYHEASF